MRRRCEGNTTVIDFRMMLTFDDVSSRVGSAVKRCGVQAGDSVPKDSFESRHKLQNPSLRRMNLAKRVTCPLCGQSITGETEDALVTAADAHGDENHGMRAPREMIISSATYA